MKRVRYVRVLVAACLAAGLTAGTGTEPAAAEEGYGFLSCLVVDPTAHTLALGEVAPFIYVRPVLATGDDPDTLAANIVSETGAFSASLAAEAEVFANLVRDQLGRSCRDSAADAVVSGPYADMTDAQMAREETRLMSAWTARTMGKLFTILPIDYPAE